MGTLPDTNILINYLKGLDPERSFVKKIIAAEELFFSPIVVAEYFAKAEKNEEILFQELLTLGTAVPIDIDIALIGGAYREQFSHKTRRTYLLDCLVAATCKIHNLILATNNTKDYPMKDIKILKPS